MSEAVRTGVAERRNDLEYRLAEVRAAASAEPIGKMILIISIIAGLISAVVILSVAAIAILPLIFNTHSVAIPEVLANWGGIILGFYFGTFVTLLKDYMGVMQANASIQNDGVKPRL